MTNKEYILEQIEKKKSKIAGKEEDMFTQGEKEFIKKELDNWDVADEKLDNEKASRFLKESLMNLIKKNSEEKNKASNSKDGLKEIEIVENCTLKDGSKSYKVVIYLTDKRTLEEAVDDYVENFNEERVVEVIKNFEGTEVKTEVSSASGSLADD